MRRLLSFLFLLAMALCTFAADIIITRSGEKITAVIEEVCTDHITYHKASNPDGPLFRLETGEIASIIYNNGEVQAFEEATPVVEEATQQTVSGQLWQPIDYMALAEQRKDSIRSAKRTAYKAKMEAIPAYHFVLADYAYTIGNNTHNVGLTYGWCHAVGFYVNVLAGVDGFHYLTDDYVKHEYHLREKDYQLTNEHTHQRISITPGLLVRLNSPVYLSLGAGYAFTSQAFKTTDGRWVRVDFNNKDRHIFPHAYCVQMGLFACIKGFTLKMNYGFTAFEEPYYHEAIIGIGYAIPAKKGGNK